MFGAFVARMEDNTRVPDEVNDVRRTGGGRGLRGGQEKKWMGCFLDDCSPGREGGMAQDGRNRGGTFHGEMNRCRESRGWTTACSSSMPRRDGKDQR